MLIVYRIVWWDKPLLSEAEEIECGRKIALIGKKPFVDEFLKSAGPKNYKEGVVYTRGQTIASFFFIISMFIAVFLMDKLRLLLVVLSFILGLYLISTFISLIRLNLLLNSLVKKFASHVAQKTI